MWPFTKKEKKVTPSKRFRRALIGFVIGGAITSIIGKTMLKERRRERKDDEDQE